MTVTVDQRVLTLGEKHHDVDVVFDVQLGQTPENRRHFSTELIERELDEHRTARRDLGIFRLGPHPFRSAQPWQRAALVGSVQF